MQTLSSLQSEGMETTLDDTNDSQSSAIEQPCSIKRDLKLADNHKVEAAEVR